MKKKLITTTTANPTTLVTSLPQAKRGRPLMLGELATRVQTHCPICRIRADGGTVNRHITLATATAIIKQCKPSLLKDHGGHLNLTRHWCESFMKRMGLTKRKATKAARALPENFNQEKQLYLSTIAKHIEDYQVPDSMVINFDQTEVNIIPSSERAMDDQGTKQVKCSWTGRQASSYSGPWMCHGWKSAAPTRERQRSVTQTSTFQTPGTSTTHPTIGPTRPQWSGMQRKSSCIPENTFLQLSGDSRSLICSKLINHCQLPSFTKLLHDQTSRSSSYQPDVQVSSTP